MRPRKWILSMSLIAMLAMPGISRAVMPGSVMHMSMLSATPYQGVKYGNIINFQATIVGNVDVTATPGTPFPVRVVRYGPVRAGAIDWSSDEKIMNIPWPNQPQVTLTFSNGFPVIANGALASKQGEDICFILLQGTVQVSPKACVQWAPQAKLNPNSPAVPQLQRVPGNQGVTQQDTGAGETEGHKILKPGEIRGFNPQPEPPAKSGMPIQNLKK